MKLKDARGVELEPGQIVAVSERSGNVAQLRIGTILEILDASGKVTIQWENRQHSPKVSTIHVSGEYVDRPRLVVLD